MIQCIQYRKSTFLGSSEWSTLPWSETGKNIYQQLCDKGFALAALLEDIDNAGLTKENINISLLSRLFRRLFDLYEELNLWYGEILEESHSPLYWPAQSISHSSHPKGAVKSSELLPFAFHTLLHAHTIVTFWALQIVISNAIALACEHVLSLNAQAPGHSSGSTSSQEIQDLRIVALCLLETHTVSHRRELATNIVRSMPYCLNDDMGLVSAQKSLFAIRVALFVLSRHPGEKLQWCQAMYQELYSKKGLRYAKEIAKLEGRFRAPGKDGPLRA